jgi:hypothetical protein
MKYFDVRAFRADLHDASGPSFEHLDEELLSLLTEEQKTRLLSGEAVLGLNKTQERCLLELGEHVYQKYRDYGCDADFAENEADYASFLLKATKKEVICPKRRTSQAR